MSTNETKQDPVEMLIKYLEYGQQGEKMDLYSEKCDNELIESLLFDAKATRGALSAWMKENWDGTLNDSTSRKNGVELVFIGTKGGLTRYKALTENLTDTSFLEENLNTVEELYYKRAVEGGMDVFTFSVPYSNRDNYDWNSTVLTASTPIIIDKDGKEAVAAVLGLQMKYNKFYEHFMNITKTCSHKGVNCNYTCENEEIDCYLLDNNGFIVLSETPEKLGKFFGELDPTMMQELIMSEDPKINRGVFRKIQMYDYQGICNIWRKEGSGATSMFIDPLRQLIKSTAWFVQELALLLVQFNIFSWWNGEYAYANSGGTAHNNSVSPNQPYTPPLLELLHIATRNEVKGWYDQLQELKGSGASDEELHEWYINLKKKLGPRLIGRVQCAKKFAIYDWDEYKLPSYGAIDLTGAGDCMTPCKKSYSINRVPHTNLMLLVLDAQCYCSVDPPIIIEPVEVVYNDTMMCQRLQTEIYRKRPDQCFYQHPLENSTDCGRCSLLQPSAFTTLVLLMTLLLLSH